MSGKNKKTTTTSEMPALKIGSRVRCTDDSVTGKITWANGVSVKIKWDDGEMVTWRRDELPGKPIEILAADDEPREGQSAQEAETSVAEAPAVAEEVARTEVAPASPETPPAGNAAEAPVPERQVALEATRPGLADELAAATPVPAEATPPAPKQPQGQAAASTTDTDVAVDAAKPKRQRKAPAEPKVKKVSALDAAARVLVEAGQMLTCKEMIAAMAIKGYWCSPGGQTPDATLCSAILREIKVKGEQARFLKAAPGRFAARLTA